MKIYWPDLLHPSPNRSLHLWKHEWEKHGTCAAQLEALNSQKKYFGKSLDLSKELALNRWVTWSCSLAFRTPLPQVTPIPEQHPCLPPTSPRGKEGALCFPLRTSRSQFMSSHAPKIGDNTIYLLPDIKDALVSVYGVVPKVQCLPKQGGEEVQLLAQIEVCFSKDLQLQNCMDPGEPAPRGPEARPAASLGLEVCKDGVLFYPALNKTNH
ncbi:hypothetical protein E2I00_012946 [Balaenoptera physalus]|uniref:Uncharacterized protein n=1 Tax=Balaenoptera physalus TaxID=9770 RepID=A0A643CJJ1_BALPH|nr:hypothetical protein E2I00_012946 [Balaenoptera physalus]